MAKLLRLDVAQLTDVGRKREHNEDNMAYVIPKDAQVMARKGALFIVADGMGGHAAGEVASEIAVDTVSNAYYQDENDDVPNSLLPAENMLRSGMGTTCVAAVLRGNLAYIANVGDSRAYFVRKSRIYQISQDHSWVAEQVRAGLLTEEQARTHAQRNVITRSLGTQPEVEIDVFREVLEEGDTLILCSDGLSGLVNDEDLLRTVDQFVPQESVYHLVERANENGGPDNITAIVARVQEVGVEPVNVRQPVPIGGPEISNEDTARLFAPPSTGFHLSTRNSDLPMPGSPFPFNSAPMAAPGNSDIAPQPGVQARKQQGRLFYPTLILLTLFILVAGFGGGYYLLHTNQSQTINSTLHDATTLIAQATSEAAKNPAQALRDLASAQQKLRDLKQNDTLNPDASAQLISLQNQLVSATKAAIIQYNQSGLITLLPCTSSAPTINLNTNTARSLAVLNANSSSQTYTLGQDGKIYQLVQSNSTNNANQYTLNDPFAPTNAQVTSIAGTKNQLFALSQQSNNGTPGNFAITLLSPGQNGVLQLKKTLAIDAGQIPSGQTPALITALNSGTTTVIYVVLSSSSSTSSKILAYTVDSKNVFSGPMPSPLTTSYRIISLAATTSQLFLLLADGSVWSSPVSSDHKVSLDAQVQVNSAIASPLASSAQGFNSKTTVPTATQATQKGSVPLMVPQAQNTPAWLSTASVTGADGAMQYHLFIGDPANHRVLDLAPPGPTATSGGPNTTPTTTATSTSQGSLSLVQQYVSADLFSTIKGVAIDSKGPTINVLGQQQSSSQGDLVVISTGGSQKGCAS